MKPTGQALVVRIRNWVGDVILGLPGLQMIESQGYELHLVARGKWAPSLLAGYGWPVHVLPRHFGERVRLLRRLHGEAFAARRDIPAQRIDALAGEGKALHWPATMLEKLQRVRALFEGLGLTAAPDPDALMRLLLLHRYSCLRIQLRDVPDWQHEADLGALARRLFGAG